MVKTYINSTWPGDPRWVIKAYLNSLAKGGGRVC